MGSGGAVVVVVVLVVVDVVVDVLVVVNVDVVAEVNVDVNFDVEVCVCVVVDVVPPQAASTDNTNRMAMNTGISLFLPLIIAFSLRLYSFPIGLFVASGVCFL